jgi:hypothetical protein
MFQNATKYVSCLLKENNMRLASGKSFPLTVQSILVLAAVSVVLLQAHRISAQSAAPSAVSSLKSEVEPLSFFLGQWSCEGEFPATKKPISSRVAATASLDGSWLLFRWDDIAPNQFHALEMWGYDKDAKQFTNFIFDNFGPARLFHSPGWESDKLIWTGDALVSPPNLNQRFLIERKPPNSFVISWQMHKPGADWATGDRLTCTR